MNPIFFCHKERLKESNMQVLMLNCVVKVTIVIIEIFLKSFSLCLLKLDYLCITVFLLPT